MLHMYLQYGIAFKSTLWHRLLSGQPLYESLAQQMSLQLVQCASPAMLVTLSSLDVGFLCKLRSSWKPDCIISWFIT